MRVLVTTDSFPPNCGGSGWSTWELVHGLIGRGHHVEVVHATVGRPGGVTTGTWQGVPVSTFRTAAPNVPWVRNVIKNERLWARLSAWLTTRLRASSFDILHAQHVMTTVPTVRAGRATGTPVVATVRDYWPVCYWSDLIYDPQAPNLCPGCTVGMMTRCVRPRAGAAVAAGWSLIPYLRANLGEKRRVLAQADTVIAVSSAIADDLAARAPELASTPICTIPNPVDMAPLDAVREHTPRPMADAYVLYAGKIATNKGTQFLPAALAQAALGLPLVVVGDGPGRAAFEEDARQRGLDVRMLGWRPRDEVLAWMRHARLLAFPSYGPESLSRVLIEAAALGVPIAAMDTGGTRDILHADVTALLSTDAAGFARDLGRLGTDDRLSASLAAAARADVHTRFSATSVVEQVEQVYRGLLAPIAA